MAGPAFHSPVEIHIGGQTRELMFTPRAMRTAERALKMDPRSALVLGGENSLFVMAAVALLHDEKDKVDDKRVEMWITREPTKYVELMKAVAEAQRRYEVVLGIRVDDDQGEAPAP